MSLSLDALSRDELSFVTSGQNVRTGVEITTSQVMFSFFLGSTHFKQDFDLWKMQI